MNGNTKGYQDNIKLLDPEERLTLKKLKARNAITQHRAKKQTGTTRTNTSRSHTTTSDVDDATTTTTQTGEEFEEPPASQTDTYGEHHPNNKKPIT